LNDISFNIESHESVSILGPSGSGKTTLLKLIAGTLQPDEGTIELKSRRLGYVFQDHRLLPWRTALDNILLVLKSSETDRSKWSNGPSLDEVMKTGEILQLLSPPVKRRYDAESVHCPGHCP
jgi:ABC-type nitrate/sulfonate/bicarbonate transport system ATPase subunit